MAKNVCEVVIDVLRAAGVRYIFGIPGDAVDGLIEAIRKQDQIKFVHVRHEEAGAFAASAMAKLTGQPAVCAGTAGPGAIHLLNGLYDAKMDHAPVLAITGQIRTVFQGAGSHQEVDLEALFDDVAVFNQSVINPEQMPRLIEEALRNAVSRKGVAHLSLPFDVAVKEVESYDEKRIYTWNYGRMSPAEDDLRKAAALLNHSEKVVILAGAGALRAKDDLLRLAELLKAPIVKALRGKSLLPDEHPYSLGGLGLLGTRPAVNAMDGCDCLLMVGTDFPYTSFLPQKTKAIQIDDQLEQLGKRIPLEVGLVGDASLSLRALIDLVAEKKEDGFLKGLQDDMKEWWEKMDSREQREDEPIHPQALASAISRYAPENTVYCCDTGAVTVWAARCIRIRNGQDFILSGGLASMAFGLSAAIGAAFACPNRKVIALSGDGSFAMLMGDFLTAVMYRLPIIIVVFNNGKLGLIQMEQEVEGWPEYETGLLNPDFAQFARLCGGDGQKVRIAEELPAAMQRALESKKPFVLDVDISGEELTMPPRIMLGQALGYARAKVLEFFERLEK